MGSRLTRHRGEKTSMNTILALFGSSLLLALLVTPLITYLAVRFDLVDKPSGRKVHTRPIPRIGGVAIFFAFFAPFVGMLVYSSDLITRVLSEPSLLWVLGGASIVFLMGLMDDILCLGPGVKFGVQTAAALVAYFGGVRIVQFQLPWAPAVYLGVLSLPLTVFWFLLVINAINLIDGLDGLAAGTSLFVSLVLLVSSLIGGNFLVATGLAAFAGACLGFLRYNFNPASIFMGDSGSYFLGYMLAALSILGSVKSQATVAILIPIIALGFPLIDAVLAPIRRFVVGKQPFMPDKNHIHHRLLRMGLSHRNAVLILYGATIFLGFFALLLVHARDQRAAFILLITGVSLCVGLHKLGYLEYLAVDKVVGYLQDVTDAVGLQRNRRTFLSHQIAIDETVTADELWERIVDALKLLKIDEAEIRFEGVSLKMGIDGHYIWSRNESEKGRAQPGNRLMAIDLPLADAQRSYGVLQLRKDLGYDPISRFTLKRIEHLRQSLIRKLKTFEEAANLANEKPGFGFERMPGSSG